MQKTHMKLGLIIAMASLFLAAGTFIPVKAASAHTVQPAKKFHHWFLQTPHITVNLLSASGRHSKNAYTGRAVISGIGFNAANGYGPCDSCGNNTSANTSTACIYVDCGTSTMTTTTTSTTTSTTTTSPSSQPGTDATCPNSCGDNAPAGPSDQPGTDATCPNSCGDNAPAGPSNQPGATCPSSCGGSAPVAPRNQPGATCPSSCDGSAPVAPSTSTTCPSSCGGSTPVGPSDQPGTTCPSYSDCGSPASTNCGCNTVNLQSSAPISAYAPGVNLSRVPVNAFGEFRVVVNVRPPVRHYTVPTIWAINTYNDQPSNYAPMCYCA